MKLFHIISIAFTFIISAEVSGQVGWVQKQSIASNNGTSGQVGFAIGSKGYIGLGYNGPGTWTNNFWEYNQATNTWTQKASFGGSGRVFAVGFAIGSKGYIGTGYDNNSKNDFWEYDPSNNTWLQRANFPGVARWGATGFAIGNYGYIGTGYTSESSITTNDFWRFDPLNNSWASIANPPGTGHVGSAGFSINGKGYFGTGETIPGFNNSSDFFEYNPSTNAWTQKQNFPGTPREDASSFAMDGKGYLGFGLGSNPLSDFWEYNPLSDSWIQKTSPPTGGRAEAAAFAIGSVGYVCAGYGAMNDFWSYAGLLMSQITTSPLSRSSYCLGSSFTVNFTAAGVTNSSNTFSVQLSNASGTFPFRTIGTANSTIPISINCTLPTNIPYGNGYRIRVVASDPGINGTDNGSNIIILNPSDGDSCTNDFCDVATSIVSHSPVIINDGNACTTDGCLTSTGVYHTPININDNNACTVDACNTQSGVVSHTLVNVNDNSPCTIDGCDPLTGIYHTPASEICNNGIDDDCDGLIDEQCSVSLQVKFFIEGYYISNGNMRPVVDPINLPLLCDTIMISLHNTSYPYNVIYFDTSTVNVNGIALFTLPISVTGNSYYIEMRHRNTIATWSSTPIQFTGPFKTYIFSDAITKAYGNNMVNTGDGNFAFWSGDISDAATFMIGKQDGIIEAQDFLIMENAVGNILTGYKTEDVTGDGIVESEDYIIMENNVAEIIFSMYP